MFEISSYHILLAALGLAIILAYWLPRFVSGREPVAYPLLIGLGFVIFGWIPGMPDALSPITTPRPWEIIAELTVIVGLFGVGLRIDRLTNRHRWIPTLRLLVVAMPLTIFGLACVGWAFAGLSLAGAVLLGAVLAPTDPVLAGDVQVGRPTEGGEHPVRFTLTTEAGLNDGLAFPFVHLGVALAAAGAVTGGLLGEWLWRDLLYRVIMGGVSGVAIGWLLGKVLFDFPKENALAKTESGVIALAGVLVAYGVTELLEGYGFIAAFVSGLVLRRSETHHEFHTRLHDFSESLEHALTALLLIGLGAVLPALVAEATWVEWGVALALILLIRPLFGWLSLHKTILTGKRRWVAAAYGVRGVGSIYYLGFAGSHTELADEPKLWAIVGIAILLSTVLHGFTASFAVEKATGVKQTD
jgi:NhaP-type Na+/H+ or K+/H+ antiporter